MSQDKGQRAAAWVAEYLHPWWPTAEKTPNGRSGADIDNTPGVSFEIKTGTVWRESWLKQAAKYRGKIKILIYLPPGCGAANVANAQMIMPMHVGMQLLEAAGYAPPGNAESRSG